MELNDEYYISTQYDGEEPQKPQKPQKKHGKLKKIIAGILAVVIIGGGSGFGGAYIASQQFTQQSSGNNSSDDPAVTTPATSSDDPAINNAVDALKSTGESSTSEKLDSVTPSGTNGEYTSSELYEAVKDTIVMVNNYQTVSSSDYGSYFGYGDNKTEEKENSEPVLYGYGSGIVFTADGYIITNAHVVDGAEKITVQVYDYDDDTKSEELEATLVGCDDDTDLAVLKVSRDKEFNYANIGDSDSLKIGQDVCAIGNPGVTTTVFDRTMTKGIVSGLNRYSTDSGYSLSSIQIDAAVNPGNSGGALFDMYGNVVGVVNSKIVVDEVENIGFAITINEAKPVLTDLVNYGYVTGRPVLGIITREISEYLGSMYGVPAGLLVVSINDDSKAKNSDLQVNDIITEVNGTAVTTVAEVQDIIKAFKAGDTIELTVIRESLSGANETATVKVELSEYSNSSND